MGIERGLLEIRETKQNCGGYYSQNAYPSVKELEADELITRKVYLEVPPKVEYSFTDTGKELIPFISQMRRWGKKQMSAT